MGVLSDWINALKNYLDELVLDKSVKNKLKSTCF